MISAYVLFVDEGMAAPLPTTLPDISALEAHAGAAVGQQTATLTLSGLTLPSVLLNVHVGLNPEQQQSPNLGTSAAAADATPKQGQNAAKQKSQRQKNPNSKKSLVVGPKKQTEKKDGKREQRTDADNKPTEKKDSKKSRSSAAPPVMKKPARAKA